MKFRIRFADQIVGIFIILGLASVIFVIIMLGKSQRWFDKDFTFTSSFTSASGLSNNMAVQFRGFTIGNVKSFVLAEDNHVDVRFIIYEGFLDRVREGSIVEVVVSPIGMGNQFLFHPGKGELLGDGAFIPVVGSAEAQELIDMGLADVPQKDDSISLLLSRVNNLLGTVNTTVTDLDNAFKGNSKTVLGRIFSNVEETLEGAKTLPAAVQGNVDDLVLSLNSDLEALKPILANIDALTGKLSDPDGTVYKALDANEPVYQNLVASLVSVSGILKNLDKTTAALPGQMPQIAGLLQDVRGALTAAESVLIALTNNPLLRGGVPKQTEVQTGGTGLRDVRF